MSCQCRHQIARCGRLALAANVRSPPLCGRSEQMRNMLQVRKFATASLKADTRYQPAELGEAADGSGGSGAHCTCQRLRPARSLWAKARRHRRSTVGRYRWGRGVWCRTKRYSSGPTRVGKYFSLQRERREQHHERWPQGPAAVPDAPLPSPAVAKDAGHGRRPAPVR